MNVFVFSLFIVPAKHDIEPDIDATTACNAEAIQTNDVVDDFNLSSLNISAQESMKNCYEQLIKTPNSSTITGRYIYVLYYILIEYTSVTLRIYFPSNKI